MLNIRNLEGNITEKQDDVLLEYERQYAQLFKSGNTDPSSIEEFMLETPHGTANAEDRIRLGNPIKENEVLESINDLTPNKSPGEDGFII